MTLQSLLDALRVVGASVLIFVLVPWRLMRADRSSLGCCAVVVRTVLFLEISALVLGIAHLCLPGAMAGAYLLFCLFCRWQSGRPMEFLRPDFWHTHLRRIALLFDGTHRGPLRLPKMSLEHPLRESQTIPGLRPLLWICLPLTVAAFSYPLGHVSFLTSGAYSRALNLQMLTLGQRVTLDGSVAWLAPVVFLSGLDAATVIRFSSPLLVLVLAAASAMASRRSKPVAAAAAGLTSLVALSPWINGELGPGGIAAIFWLLALALAPVSRWDAIWGIGLALLIGFPDRFTLLCVSSTVLVLAATFAGRRLPRPLLRVTAAVALGAILVLGIYLGMEAPTNSLYEYESVASQAARISRSFPHNRWLVISPGQELPFTYGRGWHVELSEFINSYSLDQVLQPHFRFAFPVQTAFVFIEKRPLPSQLAGDPLYSSVFEPGLAYRSPRYHETMEFQAGELLAAYSSSHSDAEIFFEDQDVVIYRLRM